MTSRPTRELSILVAHPRRQHSDQLAAALVAAGMRTVYVHGSAIRPSLTGMLAGHTERRAWGDFVAKIASRTLPALRDMRVAQHVDEAFDRRIAAGLARWRPNAVIAYENAAVDTFRAAHRLGITTILDAASVHHDMQAAAGINDAGTPFRNHVDARKDAEIAFADHILCCSTLAARSYVDAGVAPGRVHAVPLGFDRGLFSPEPSIMPARDGPLRLAFVGRFSATKGADLMADALAVLRARDLPFECRIAAARANGDAAMITQLEPLADLLGKVAHGELTALYRWADLLVMPSRFDSFGLVVLEALACGLPVLASNHVGASDFIRPGVNGDVVPFDAPQALADALTRYAADPGLVRAMRPAAIESVRDAEWSGYRARVARIVTDILN